MKMIIDAHEDLACAMLGLGRDYMRSAAETRRLEEDKPHIIKANGQTLLGWPEYQQGQVALVFGTLFATPKKWQRFDWDSQTFSTPAEAHELNLKQMSAYRQLVDQHPDAFQLVSTKKKLNEILIPWQSKPASFPEITHPVGLVMLMEGADGIRTAEDLEMFWEMGLRIIGPVWAGNRFSGGTREPGPLTSEGKQLLQQMAAVGYTVDLSHMSNVSVLEALDLYEGEIIASHANSNALLKYMPFERHFEDAAIRKLVERDGVMGVIPFNVFLDWEWKSGNPRETVKLEHLVQHIDHICQIAGDARHVGIGSDFDGGFGFPDVPFEIETIADLQKLENLLLEKGYNDADTANILYGNWKRKLETILPD
jgi:membrane dipeptidase